MGALLVLVLYLVQRHRQRGQGVVIHQLPLDIRQSATGWTLTRAVGGRTLFRAQAASAVRLRSGERAVLKQVTLQLFEAQGGRVDQIYGDEFDFDPASNEIRALGLVHIDLAGKPAAMPASPAPRSPPTEESGNPIHIETNDLVFNVKSGNGEVQHGLEFRYLNATGRADTAQIATHPEAVVLGGSVRLDWNRPGVPVLHVESDQATLDRSRLQVVLTGHARVQNGTQELHAERFELQLRPDFSVTAAQAFGKVAAQDLTPTHQINAHADQATADLSSPPASSARSATPTGLGRELLQGLRLTGAVDLKQQTADHSEELQAAAVDFRFGPANLLQKIEVRGGTRVTQDVHTTSVRRPATPTLPLSSGHRTLEAAGLDVFFAGRQAVRRGPGTAALMGSDLSRIVVLGRGHLHSASQAPGGDSLDAEADRMELHWLADNRLSQALATGNVVLDQAVAEAALRLNRHSSAATLALDFSPRDGQLRQVTESGRVEIDEKTAAGQVSILRADRVQYAAASTQVRLGADPGSDYSHGRVDGATPQLRFAASSAVWDRSTGEVTGDGGVQVSFLPSSAALGTSAPTLAPAGPLFGNARAPVDAVADHMQVNLSRKQGTFTGHARMFQGANLTAGSQIDFDRIRGVLAVRNVTSMFVNPNSAVRTTNAATRSTASGGRGFGLADRSGPPSPVTITARQMDYSDAEHAARYRGSVRLVNRDIVITAPELDVFLAAPGQGGKSPSSGAPAGLQRVVASGGVTIAQPGREATAAHAVYDARHDELVLSGEGAGAPSIFDAEQGHLTGHSLTFSPASDTIRVDSEPGVRLRGEHQVRP